MNQQEVSFRSDEQAQSQDRERLQSEIQEAWDNLMWVLWAAGNHERAAKEIPESDIKLLKWHLGVK
jgi:hypothetical protein